MMRIRIKEGIKKDEAKTRFLISQTALTNEWLAENNG